MSECRDKFLPLYEQRGLFHLRRDEPVPLRELNRAAMLGTRYRSYELPLAGGWELFVVGRWREIDSGTMRKIYFLPLVLVGRCVMADSTFIGNSVTMGGLTASSATITNLGTGNVQSVNGVLVNLAISSSVIPAGSTNYIQNTNSLQSGATFFVSSGTVRGIFTVQQPDNDTSDPPLGIKSLTTQEGASNMFHSVVWYGLIPNGAANIGEFILTASSFDLTGLDPGAFGVRGLLPEVAFWTADNGNGQGIGLRSQGHQFPNSSPIGDFGVLGGTCIASSPLQLTYLSPGFVQLDSNLIFRNVSLQYVSSVTASPPLIASTAGTEGSTVTIRMTNNLPGGSTSYVGATALYISSITTDASLISTFSGTSGATVTIKVAVSSNSLPNNGVTAGSYTSMNATIDSHGLVTSASNGSGGSPSGANGAIQISSNSSFGSDPTFNYSSSTLTESVKNINVSSSVVVGTTTTRSGTGNIVAGSSITATDELIVVASSVPWITSCGTTSTILGSNTAGLVTFGGTLSNTCTVNFGNGGFSSEPSCTLGYTNAYVSGPPYFSAKSATSLTFHTQGVDLVGGQFDYHCIGVK